MGGGETHDEAGGAGHDLLSVDDVDEWLGDGLLLDAAHVESVDVVPDCHMCQIDMTSGDVMTHS